MDSFYAKIGQNSGKDLAQLLDEDPSTSEKRAAAFQRLDLLRKARDEIESTLFIR